MCGIAGIIGPVDNEKDRVEAMLSAERHRGPDFCKSLDVANDVTFGHCRLSIIDLSPDANQPMVDAESGNVLTFNGEVYNFRELRAELSARGAVFRTRSDSEVILKAYATWGTDAFARFRGIFAFAIWDKSTQCAYLVRDQIGVKPLYYYHGRLEGGGDAAFLFASETRALMAGGVPRRISRAGLDGYMTFGCVQEPLTLVEGVRSLPPGTWMRVDISGVRETVVYWEPNPETKPWTLGDAQEAVSETLKDAMRLQMVSDVPLGAFLSGGIDSTAIVAMMRKNTSADIRTFSLIYDDEITDEREWSRMAAVRNHTVHQELLLSGDIVRDNLAKVMSSYDQPSLDGMNTWFITKLVKEAGMTVALSGLGGDEIFVGYQSFCANRLCYKLANYGKYVPSFVGKMFQRWAPTNMKRRAGALMGCKTEPYFIAQASFLDWQKKRLLKPEFRYSGPTERLTEMLPDDDLVNRISILYSRHFMLSQLLRDADQMSMAHSLELRVPLLDHKLVELLYSIPSVLKLDATIQKPLLARAAGDGIPEECITHPKHGFVTPTWQYFETGLKDFYDAFMRGENCMFFSPKATAWFKKDYEKKRYCWTALWSLMALECWAKDNRMGL